MPSEEGERRAPWAWGRAGLNIGKDALKNPKWATQEWRFVNVPIVGDDRGAGQGRGDGLEAGREGTGVIGGWEGGGYRVIGLGQGVEEKGGFVNFKKP